MAKKTSVKNIETKAQAKGRYLKISPTKVRDLLDLIRGENVEEAETTLKFSGRRGGEVALKVLRSAQANAGSGVDPKRWMVTDARADKGPIFRRKLDYKAQGAAGIISTPSTHITIGIGPDPKAKKEKPKKKAKSSSKKGSKGGKNGKKSKS